MHLDLSNADLSRIFQKRAKSVASLGKGSSLMPVAPPGLCSVLCGEGHPQGARVLVFPQTHHGLHLYSHECTKVPFPTCCWAKDRNRKMQPEPGFPSPRGKACEAQKIGWDRHAERISERGKDWALHSQATAVGRSVSALRGRDNRCVLRKDSRNYCTSPWHFLLLLAMSHPCFAFQSGSKAQGLLTQYSTS